jgi:alpha-tubulin suppressor-like RCC1 family protein
MNRRSLLAGKAILGLALGTALVIPMSASAEPVESSTPVNRLFSEVKQIEAGDTSGYAVKEDGSAWAWGGLSNYYLGYGSTSPAHTPVKMHIDHVKQISSGYRSTLILKEDGTVWSVGGNEHGQLGNGKQSNEITVDPTQVEGLTDIIKISAGDSFSLALDRDGKVWAWGGNEEGQIGNDTRKNVYKPIQVEGLPRILDIQAGQYASIALGNGGEVWGWGLAQKNTGKPDMIRKPSLILGSVEYKAIAINGNVAAAINWNGTVWTWNMYLWGPSNATLKPVQVPELTDVVSISATSAVKLDGSVWHWRSNDKGGFTVSQVQGIKDAVAISEDSNPFVLLKDGHVLSWGWNVYGQTGLGLLDQTVNTPKLLNNSIKVTLDSKDVELAFPPLIINEAAYVPLRGVFQQMGISVKWDVQSRSVVATKGDMTLILDSVTGQTTLNGKVIPFEQKPVSVSGSMLVPFRLIGEALGIKVEWNADNYSINIAQ